MKILTRLLGGVVRRGSLTIHYADGVVETIGSASTDFSDVTIRFTDAAAARAIVTNPELGAGEGYMNGRLILEQGSIWDLIMLVSGNSPLESDHTLVRPTALQGFIERMKQMRDSRNKQARSKANVAHHYDLSEKLYELFLDKDRQYSCAYFHGSRDSRPRAGAARQESSHRGEAGSAARPAGARYRLRMGRHGPLSEPRG
jgi:cyclopropane-fatty-acyl-phospholipid synthase